MSVINQVLLDLEKRRASATERVAVPSHVRALPDGGNGTPWPWIAGGAGAVGVVAAAAWTLLAGSSATKVSPPPARSGSDVIIERVVRATAGVKPADERADVSRPASRLSLELSNVPDPVEPPRETQAPGSRAVPPPLPVSRVVGRLETGAESAPPAARPGARNERGTGEKSAVVAAARPVSRASGVQPEIQKQVRQPTTRELAENEFRKSTALLHQGRLAESQEGFEAALKLYPAYHGARQALVGLLLEAKKLPEAEGVLQEGLALDPTQIGFAMTLARLQIDRGDAALAVATLKKGLDYAQGSADYIAFLAALLQRQGRHDEAIDQFQSALRSRPATGLWWLGLGISLQAANRTVEAQDAYRRAQSANSLSPELAAFAEQRLRQLQ